MSNCPRCHFLDWDRPVTEGVRDFLIPDALDGAADLSGILVIVPTRQAGRRLREALARRCAEADTALIPPLVKEPLFFLNTEASDAARVAGPLLTQAVWAGVLTEMPLSDFPGLFPTPPPQQDFGWALRTGEMIQRVRAQLVDGGYLIQDVLDQHGDQLDEPERWQDLARLEAQYLERMARTGRSDRPAQLIRLAANPVLPDTIQRVIVAAVPDPSLLMIRGLEALADHLPIDVLVHAPSSRADDFDAWGRPLREVWSERLIDIPDPEQNVLLGADPVDQARMALEVVAGEATRIGPSDLAIGVPDKEVAPYVDTHLAEHGLIAFNPAGKPVQQHRLYHALDAARGLIADPSYRAVSTFLRHPDTLRALQDHHTVDATTLLTQLDRLQNQRLPQSLADLERLAKSMSDAEPLATALALIHQVRAQSNAPTLEQAVAGIMALLYSNQTVDPQEPEGESFVTVAQRINRCMAESRDPAFTALKLPMHQALNLLLRALDGESWYTERADAQVDLEGWLELPWNDARLLIVTGMNDGMTPDSRISDVFLPDALLLKLGLRSDLDRLARDAYLMTTLIESRRHRDGRVCFMAGARSRSGDPLRPSRLLFRCTDAELPERAARLFHEPAPNTLIHPASVSFKLNPKESHGLPVPKHVGATALKSYLACPFRFYLAYVLRMRELHDDLTELDAMAFGDLVHYALQGIAQHPSEGDASVLTALFQDRATARLHEQFGTTPPLPVQIQFESIKQRLSAAAKVQAEIIAEGWIPRYFEHPVSAQVGPIELRAQIDRADYHPDLKAWRVIDYKTIDKPDAPEKTYFATWREGTAEYARVPQEKGKDKRWVDLQLPVYAHLFRAVECEGPISVAHFQLPKAVSDTKLEVWDALTDERLAQAWDCVRGILRDIENAIYWPPAEKVTYENFEPLFPFEAGHCVVPLNGEKAS